MISYIIIFLSALVIGFIMGNLLGRVSAYPKEIQGYLHIVSDPVKGDYVYLEIENADDIKKIAKSSHVVLQVTRDTIRPSYGKRIR